MSSEAHQEVPLGESAIAVLGEKCVARAVLVQLGRNPTEARLTRLKSITIQSKRAPKIVS